MFVLTPYQLKFLVDIQASDIDFIVVGGRALQAHNFERETEDLDIFVSRTKDNILKLTTFLHTNFPHSRTTVSVELLSLPQKLIPIPSMEVKEVDMLTSIGALDFGLAKKNVILISYESITIPILGLKELIYSKCASLEASKLQSSVNQDLIDIHLLQESFICVAKSLSRD